MSTNLSGCPFVVIDDVLDILTFFSYVIWYRNINLALMYHSNCGDHLHNSMAQAMMMVIENLKKSNCGESLKLFRKISGKIDAASKSVPASTKMISLEVQVKTT